MKVEPVNGHAFKVFLTPAEAKKLKGDGEIRTNRWKFTMHGKTCVATSIKLHGLKREVYLRKSK